MRVPPERLEEVAAIVSAEPLVNHNYERTHEINLWFVVAGADEPARRGHDRADRAADRLAGARSAAGAGLSSSISASRLAAHRAKRAAAPRPAADYRPMRATATCSPRSRTDCRWSSGPIATWRSDSGSSEDDVHRSAAAACRQPASSRASAASCAIARSAIPRMPWRCGTCRTTCVDAVAGRFARNPQRDAVLPPAAAAAATGPIICSAWCTPRRGATPTRRSTTSISSAETGLNDAGGAVLDALLQAARRACSPIRHGGCTDARHRSDRSRRSSTGCRAAFR